MKIAYISFEVFPFAKVGGLADVAGALPKYINKTGEKIFVLMPYHRIVDKNAEGFLPEIFCENMIPEFHSSKKPFSVYKTKLSDSDVDVYLIKNEDIFYTEDIYGGDNLAFQSTYFCDSAITFIKKYFSDTDVINVNDWQTALIPVYLKTVYSENNEMRKISTVFTIHNLGYQGLFDSSELDNAGLPGYLYNVDALEFYGKVNFLKGGILFSDVINTVSKTYGEEIQTSEYSYGLDGVLKIRSDRLYGIINGIDYKVYNPSDDPSLFFPINNYADKIKNKKEFQKFLKLPERPDVPVISLISRLVDQKGLDLIFQIFEYLMLFDVQFVLLGTGDKKYMDFFSKMEEKYPEKVSANLKFDLDLAQKIYGSSDMFLMPSKYEPCGLGQMYAMRYGTVPVVRYTGGLADTVS
ncbi:MAG TPA: glycogen/starch synthase, partial [Tepiditoga sp.]|nr:glycogen/starch synthase [Tepiditoga sp.]